VHLHNCIAVEDVQNVDELAAKLEVALGIRASPGGSARGSIITRADRSRFTVSRATTAVRT
jgi:hypothetical protein